MTSTTSKKLRKLTHLVIVLNIAVAFCGIIGSMLTGKILTIPIVIVFILSAITFVLSLIMAMKEKNKPARRQ